MMNERSDEDTVDFDVPELVPTAEPVSLLASSASGPVTVTLTPMQDGQVGVIAPDFPPIVVRPPAKPGKSPIQVLIELWINETLKLVQPIQIAPPS